MNDTNTNKDVTDYTYTQPQFDERFLREPSKVEDAMEFLDIMLNANKMEDKRSEKKGQQEKKDFSKDVTDDNFLIFKRSQSARFSSKRSRSKIKFVGNTNQFTFMRQIDKNVEERSIARFERERVANNFRRLGNYAYRKGLLNNAIDFYNHGLNYITDTPVLYLNRACCYLKLRSFQRAIMDCDYILNKLDPKQIRAWLYRALAFKRLNDENSFNHCVHQVKRLNSKEIAFIDGFLERMHSAF